LDEIDLPLSFLTTDGASLVYNVLGYGHPIVFIHGFTLNRNAWAGQIAALAVQNQVVIYDLRGHGQSGSDPTDYSNQRILYDLAELVEHLGIHRVILCGHSLGASIAVRYTLTYPHFVSGLILVSPYVSGFVRPRESIWNRVQVPFSEIARRCGIAVAKNAWEHFELFAWARRRPEISTLLGKMISTFSGAPWIHQVDGKREHPALIERLNEIVCPVLIFCGEHDDVLYRSVACHISAALPQAALISIPSGGHLCNLEDPNSFIAAASEFACRLDQPDIRAT
jgi:3-oxoadipate enol-lactonase